MDFDRAFSSSYTKAPLLYFHFEAENLVDCFVFLGKKTGKYEVFSIKKNESIYCKKEDFFQITGIQKDKETIFYAPEPIYPLQSEKGTAHLSNIQSLLQFLKPEVKDIWVLFIYGIGTGLFSLIVPVATSSLINTLAFGTLLQPVIILTVFVFFFLLLAGGMNIMQNIVTEYLRRRLFVRFSSEISSRIMRYDEQSSPIYLPDIVSYYFEVFTLQKNVTSLLIDGLGLIVITVVGLLFVSIYHPLFLFYSLVFLVLLYILIFIRLKSGTEAKLKESKQKYKVYHLIEDLAEAREYFTTQNGEKYGYKRIDSQIREYLKYREKNFKILIKQSGGAIFLQASGHALLLGLGGFLVIKQQLSLGQLVAAELILAKVLDGFSGVGKYLEIYYGLLAAVEKIKTLIEIPSEKRGFENLQINSKSVQLKIQDLLVHIAGIYNLNCEFNSGKPIGLYASEEADKLEILFRVLSGKQKIDSGVILVNGHDLRNLLPEIRKSLFGYLNRISIFHGTIYENIKQGENHLGIQEIRALLEKLGVMKDISRLEKEIFTELHTSGFPLQYRQLKAICIAREFLRKNAVIILDRFLDDMDEAFIDVVLDYMNTSECSNKVILVHTQRKDILQKIENRRLYKDNQLLDLKLK